MPEAIVPTTKTATRVKTLTGYTGDAALYKLDPPVELIDWDDNKTGATEYVVVSATVAFDTGAETYIFPGNEKGDVTDWGELHGSFKGALDHRAALKGAGYEVVS